MEVILFLTITFDVSARMDRIIEPAGQICLYGAVHALDVDHTALLVRPDGGIYFCGVKT